MKRTGRICAMRGRNPDNPSDRTPGILTEQRIEIKGNISNCITTVAKDSMILGKVKRMDLMIVDRTEEEKTEDQKKTVEDYLYTAADGEQYGIFKLSPRECGRLMGVKDSDIDKMLSVNSNSQCYKQYGNSIVVPVLCGIFSQLNIKGVTPWNKASYEQRQAWINPDGLKAEDGE